ncbi:piggyBac transposable element-derived protein 3-like [Amyelois transitella]|uniref:piggyBac transposable element-derived protein 3-like n=1 Tax=Amyelois transitella TaxID=680683 RepID=UPI0029907082|nr:piggyBac transposable element-derived protein 3-like [Amyelois transitella]
MAARGWSVSRKGLKVHEIISALECEDDDDFSQNVIFVEPPIEKSGQVTDEDSDKSDDEHDANLNHLGHTLLDSKCELRRYQVRNRDVMPSSSSGMVFSNAENPQVCSSSEESDDEDNQPLASLRTRISPPKKSKLKRTSLWKKDMPSFSCPEFITRPTSDESKNCKDPLDYFKLFFHSDLVKLIVDQTNLYAGQKNKPLLVTEDEIYVIFGAMLLSGYAKLPCKRLYFSKENDVPKILSDSIRCNRFEAILQHLHFNDNTFLSDSSDRLYKLRPLLDSLSESFRKHYGLDEHYSVDESMIPYYGKHYAKQFIRGKPIRFGFKNWALCASTGYMVAFSVYTGKATEKKDFGLGGDVVLSLVEQGKLPSKSGVKIYFDNFFTSLSLLRHLRVLGFYATGTVRANRIENCPLKDVQQVKREDRGYYDYRMSDDVFICRWNDNNVVTVATNFENWALTSATRWSNEKKSKISIPQPAVIASYNKNMGGVDKCDQAVANLRTRMRIRKWWWPIFAYFIDVSVVNGWFLARKNDCKKETDSLLHFRRYIARSLLIKHGTPPHQGQKPSKPMSSTRYDGKDHWIVPIGTERRCANQCGGKAKFQCLKCDVGLHPKCFMEYHITVVWIDPGIYPYNRFGDIDFAPSFVTIRPNPDTEDNIPAVPSPGRTRPNPNTENKASAKPSHTTSRTGTEDISPVISRPIPDNQEDAPIVPFFSKYCLP